jgi:hypothetical protein
MLRLPIHAIGYCELRVRDVEHDVVELEAMWNLDGIALTRDAPCPSCSGVAEHLNSKPIGMTMRRDRARNGFAGTRAQFELVDLLDGRYFVGLKNAPRAYNVRAVRHENHSAPPPAVARASMRNTLGRSLVPVK